MTRKGGSSSSSSNSRGPSTTSSSKSKTQNNHSFQSSAIATLLQPPKKRKAHTKPTGRTAPKSPNKQLQHNENSTITQTPPKSTGEAVQQATTVKDLLQAASQLWLPTDADLPRHLTTQEVHHERRQRWSAQLLAKLGDAYFYSGNDGDGDGDTNLLQDDRLGRAVLAAALPFDNNHNTTNNNHSEDDRTNAVAAGNEKEQRSVREALLGLSTLLGHVVCTPSTTSSRISPSGEEEKIEKHVVHPDILSGTQLLMERAEAMADSFPLPHALEVWWAVRGLAARLGHVAQKYNQTLSSTVLPDCFPRLEHRVKALPFDILPMGVDFSDPTFLLHHDHDTPDTIINNPNESLQQQSPQKQIMTSLQTSIPFQFDAIVTRHGQSVTERRGTAWLAEDGIGALAYSGKLMPPSPVPSLVRTIMRRVEQAIDNIPTAGNAFFDCALCNYYPDGDSACKFHTDPEHGTMWERLNCVVALGNARRFAFRPNPGITTWETWESSKTMSISTNNKHRAKMDDDMANLPAVIRVFPGDVVQMYGTCNEDFQHAVYPESATILDHETGRDLSRVSLVMKRAMVNGGKRRRGHGIAGEGRKARHHKMRTI